MIQCININGNVFSPVFSYDARRSLLGLVFLNFRPRWNFDGSSTGQAPGEDSEVIIYPQAIYPDPFRGGDNIMVLCDCYKPDGTRIDSNTRQECAEVMKKVCACVLLQGTCNKRGIFIQQGQS